MSTTTPSESLDRFIALWQAGRLADAVGRNFALGVVLHDGQAVVPFGAA